MATLGVTLTAARASKKSQKSASYQGSPKGGERCDNCRLWQAPAACRSVEGPISPKGWCALYVKA
ncbi:MAG: high-potential iron-sulfur protein [Xanthobacteraceae bacterium]